MASGERRREEAARGLDLGLGCGRLGGAAARVGWGLGNGLGFGGATTGAYIAPPPPPPSVPSRVVSLVILRARLGRPTG